MKGNNKVQRSNGKYTIDMAVPTTGADVNAVYTDVIHALSTKPPNEKKMDAATTQDDFYHSFWAKYAVSILILEVTHVFCFITLVSYSMFMVWVLSNVGRLVDPPLQLHFRWLMICISHFQALLVAIIL